MSYIPVQAKSVELWSPPTGKVVLHIRYYYNRRTWCNQPILKRWVAMEQNVQANMSTCEACYDEWSKANEQLSTP